MGLIWQDNDMTVAPDISAYEMQQLQQGQWFHSLPAHVQQQLLSHAKIKHLTAQQYLFYRNDAFDGLYCVLEGALRINSHNEQGKEALLAVIEPCNWFGEIALIDGLPRTHDAVAEKPSKLLWIPPAALEQMLQDNPLCWRYLAQLSTQKIRFTFASLEENALFPAFKRVVSRLIVIAEGYGELSQNSRRVLNLPQEQLASMLAISRQTTNQILKQLEMQQLIRVDYREVEILDLAGLKQLNQKI